jgi:hemerythrin-like metal-binding protein
MYFSWTDDMSVGNSMLDFDHRQLIGLVNELHTATSRGEGRAIVGDILGRLLSYTEGHFQREEHHMENMRYSRIAEHKEQHQQLLERLRTLQQQLEAGHVSVAAKVSILLRDWLSIHLQREDKQFAAEMKNNAMGAIPPNPGDIP